MTAPAFDPITAPLDGLRFVEASAGTGKTWTLSVLYLRLLLERGLEVRQILVTTFTQAATAELKERLRARLVELQRAFDELPPQSSPVTAAGTLAAADPSFAARPSAAADRSAAEPGGAADPFAAAMLQRLRALPALPEALVRQRLALALGSFDEAAVHTIHGFCQRALELGAFSAGVPFALEAVEDDAELRRQVVNDFWRRRIAGARLPAGLAAHLVARRFTPERLAAELQRRIAKPLAIYRWPDDAAPDAPADDALAALHRQLRALWQAGRETIVAIVDDARPRLRNASHFAPERLAAAARAWDRLLALDDPAGNGADTRLLALLAAARLQPRKGEAALPPHPFFAPAQQWLDLRNAAEAAHERQRLALLRELLDTGPALVRAAKRERRLIGYDDMLFDLQQRLEADRDGRLAEALRARYPAALVDEFQDTDPLQVAILQRLFGGATAFLVGDPKQAIYGFRNADLHTYLRARDAAGTPFGTLRDNQRSTPALVAALNRLFGANPRAFVIDGIDYPAAKDGARPRPPLADATGAPRAALQLWRLPPAGADRALHKAQALRLAAGVCADEIVRLLAAARRGEVLFDGRPLAARDLAVLVRTRAHGRLVREALLERGVRSADLERTSLYATVDAQQLLQWLRAAAEPARERLLRAALATDAMGRDAAAIEQLDRDPQAYAAAVARFAEWHDAWQQRGVAWMLRAWQRADGVARRLLARPDGERRLTNLRHLAECLHEAEHAHRAPEALLRWFAAQCAEPPAGEATQLRLESDADLVQVVTIHRCKGLEYPIVFCPMLFDGSDGAGERGVEGVAWHDDEGRAVIDLRPDGDAKARAKLERRAEMQRLLYVALTRAVHRCHVVVGCYASRVSDPAPASLHSALNWLAAGAGVDPAAWLRARPDADAVDAAWDRLAATSGGTIGLQPCPAARGTPLPPRPGAPELIEALPPPAHIPAGRRLGSYSSLVHGARPDAAAGDRDQRVEPAAAGLADGDLGEITDAEDDRADATAGAADILHFPRGPAAGDCLHALLERVDFGDAAGWPAAVAAVLQQHAAALPPAADATLRPRMLLQMLHDVLRVPLPGAAPLARVPARRRIAELEFHLPAHRLEPAALGALLQRHGVAAGPLHFRPLDGHLRGFVDLVFEHGGRWYLADWKSNHLGATPAHYAPAALRRAMVQHGYGLQALLYTLALHRHLRRQLDDYDYDRHFGGAYYLFLRGLRPGWVDVDGAPCGVHHGRPAPALVDELDALLAGGGAR
jgi:exodeoxyribonuclease V beta subunit